LALDEPKEAEAVEQMGGLAFIVEAQVRPHIAGQVIDYVRSWRGEGFAIQPAAGGCC
jgi:Fe-S cluster assembly iron-binding protein IscA